MQTNTFMDKAMLDPSKVFATPDDVLAADLATDKKLKILKQWEDEAHQLQAATDEAMTGGERPQLEAVRKAIDKLEHPEDSAKTA